MHLRTALNRWTLWPRSAWTMFINVLQASISIDKLQRYFVPRSAKSDNFDEVVTSGDFECAVWSRPVLWARGASESTDAKRGHIHIMLHTNMHNHACQYIYSHVYIYTHIIKTNIVSWFSMYMYMYMWHACTQKYACTYHTLGNTPKGETWNEMRWYRVILHVNHGCDMTESTWTYIIQQFSTCSTWRF